MSVLIKGMEMPEQGYVDVRVFADGICTTESAERPYYKQYDVVEVPTPHGRLIDADAFERMDFSTFIVKDDVSYVPFTEVATAIFKAPTVIEAEEANND